jgi:hypothetical protein
MLLHLAYGENSSHGPWKSFSAEQKRYALFGFIDCHRLLFPRTNASMYKADERVYGAVDRLAAANGDMPMGQVILDAMIKTPSAASDSHAEHGSVNDGMLWRGLVEQEKEAYVQGVFWCAEIAPPATVSLSQKSVGAAVKTLDDWYVVSDDDWKDPRSNARVDVRVVVAMQRTAIVSIKPATTP